MRFEAGVGGRLETVAVSNGMRGVGAGRLDVAPEGIEGLSLRAQASGSRGADLVTPDYVLGNTASSLWTAGVSGRLEPLITEIRPALNGSISVA